MKLDGINHITIIGTGMIGASMAALFTGNGYSVTMLAIDEQQGEAGKKRYDECFCDLVAKGLVTEKQHAACARLLGITQNYEDVADTDFIFESVFERIDVKHSVYRCIERRCHNYQALASSTSALSADDLAEGLTKDKAKLVGAHPWNPPHLVPSIELVGSRHSSPQAIRVAYDVLESVGRKVVVMKKPAPGFIGNRLQHALYREAVHMIEQGIASPEDIDKTLTYSFYSALYLYRPVRAF